MEMDSRLENETPDLHCPIDVRHETGRLRERDFRSAMLRDFVWRAADDTQFTSWEVALIISPEYPSIVRVSQLKRAGLLKAVARTRRSIRYRAADVRDYLNTYR